MNSSVQKLDTSQAQVRGETSKVHAGVNLRSWEKRLASRSAQLATGRRGSSLQQVMDELRN